MILEKVYSNTQLGNFLFFSKICSFVFIFFNFILWWSWSSTMRCLLCQRQLRRWALSFLLIANSSCFWLQITNLTKIQSHSSSPKWIGFRFPTILFKSCSKPSDQRIEAPPRLPKRARTRCRRVRQPVERANDRVHFRLSKLI